MLPKETRISQNQSPPKDTETTRIRWAAAALLQCSLSSINDTTTPFLSMVVHPQRTSVDIQDSLKLPMARCNNLQCTIKVLTAVVGMEHLIATVDHLRATVEHLRATVDHLRATVDHLKATVDHLKAMECQTSE
jgi:hypothetical protein